MIETVTTSQTKINKAFEAKHNKIKAEATISTENNSFSGIQLTLSACAGVYSDNLFLHGMDLDSLIEFRNMIDSLVDDTIIKCGDMFPDKLITLCK